MAGDDDGYGVAADGLSYGLRRAAAHTPGYGAVGGGHTVRYLPQSLPYALLEGGAARLQRRQEVGAPAGEVEVEPTPGSAEYIYGINSDYSICSLYDPEAEAREDAAVGGQRDGA